MYDSAGKLDPNAGVPLDDVVLIYDRSDNLVERLLHGPSIDQPLASEDGSGDVLWLLADNQGTIRDVAEYDAGTDTTTLVNHLKYDGFGQITAQSDSNYEPRHTYTGREWDADSDLFYYRARWYDSTTGRFISEDPIGFSGTDSNLSRYVGNATPQFTDPSGHQASGPTIDPAQTGYSYTPPLMPSHTSGAPTVTPYQTQRVTVPATSTNVPHTWLSQTLHGSAPWWTRAVVRAQYAAPPVTTLPIRDTETSYGAPTTEGLHFSNIPPEQLCGSGGAGPCIIVVIISPPTDTGVDVWAYHFGTTQYPAATLGRSGPFPPGSAAYLAGGDTSNPSAGALRNAVDYLESNPNVTIQGFSNSSGLWADRLGNLYVHEMELR